MCYLHSWGQSWKLCILVLFILIHSADSLWIWLVYLRCLNSLILSLDDHYIRPQCHKACSRSEMLLLYRYLYSPKVTVVLYSKTEHIICIYKKRFLRSVLILNTRDVVWKSNSFNFPSVHQEAFKCAFLRTMCFQHISAVVNSQVKILEHFSRNYCSLL